MHIKKIAILTLAIIFTNYLTPTTKALAYDLVENISDNKVNNEIEINTNKAIVTNFDLNKDDLTEYDKEYRIDNKNITITSEGGIYGGSTIDKAIDGKLDTHWETGTPNSSSFTNKVIFKFNEEMELNRIVYAARQDGAKGKGFANEFKIYASSTDSGEDFTLVSEGEYKGSTGDLIEIKFDKTKFKRLKFEFTKANRDWASASEFMFYKEDQVFDKVKRLFTDTSMSKVIDEFNSVEEINKLEEEIKNHPLQNYFKKDIENAKALVNKENVVYSNARVSKFKYQNSELLSDYDKEFKVSKDDIENISTNGGQYADNSIEKTIDGNLETKWHSGKKNSNDFTNELTIELKEPKILDRVVYIASRGTNRGFAQAFDIYASCTSKGDNFELVSSGEAKETQDAVEIRFNPTKFKRLKFVFKKGYENWACAAEFGLYTEDKVSNKVDSMFTNGLMNELTDDFNTEEKLNALEQEVKSHPLKTLLEKEIEYAKEVLKNQSTINSIIEVDRRGNSIKESQKRKLWNFQDWQVTGLTARPGDVLQVYVDVKKGEPAPTLVYKQSVNRHGGTKTFQLVRGKNTIVIPEYDNVSDDVDTNTIFGGALYITNYDSDKQTQSPRVRIEGAKKYPMYVAGKSNDEQVMKELEDYVQKVKQDPENTVDVFDISTNQTLTTVKATYALEWYKKNNKMPSYTANRWEQIMDKIYEFWGFDNSTELNSRFNSRMVFMTKNITGGTFMNAGGGIVGVRPSSQDAILGANTGWGLMHEIGHNMDTSGRTMSEITNNIVPIYMASTEGKVTRITTDNVWERKIYTKVTKEDYSNNLWQDPSGEDSLAQLSPLWQLNLYDNTFYPKFEQAYRANDFKLRTREEITQSWVKVSSDILHLNLYEFFERHGIHASEQIKNEVSQYPTPDKKLWYLNDNRLNYKGNGFSEDTKVDVSLNRLNNSVKLTFNVDKNSQSDLLGYEILKDDKLIGFTSTNTFTDTNVDNTKNSIYKVIPYDNNLGTGKATTISLFAPSVSIQQEKITLKLRESFNPMDYIKVFDYQNNDIISKVKVESNVDINNKGLYQVKYTVSDNGSDIEKIVDVEVVSGYDYLSDYTWKSVETQWGTPSINKDLRGKVNGEEKTFEKGFGIHANGKITYDLSDKDYDKFEAFVGVNHATIAENENSSIKFKVIADGQVLTTTNTIKYSDNMVYISVPVKNVNTLEIEVTDSGNGNTGDHGLIANPILTTNNAKPKLINISNKILNLGQSIDLREGITALDAEDGDITSQIEITGKVNVNKSGRYPVTYSITDRDGNKVEITRTILIVDMEKGTYLSDIEWKSANSGWESVKKDKSVANNPLRLTGKDGEVVEYEKGIGTHSSSTIVYDLTDKNYSYFTSYIGVDREMYNSPYSSIEFKIYVDGNLKYDSGLMYANDEQKYVELDIDGAKELKLVVTNGQNGISGDHGSFGDAKLYSVDEQNSTEIDSIEVGKQGNITFTLSEATQISLEDVRIMCKGGNQMTIFDLTTKDNKTYTISTPYYKDNTYELYINLPNNEIISKDFMYNYNYPTVSNVTATRNSKTKATLDIYDVDEDSHLYYLPIAKLKSRGINNITSEYLMENGIKVNLTSGYNNVEVSGLKADKQYDVYYMLESFDGRVSPIYNNLTIEEYKAPIVKEYTLEKVEENKQNNIIFTFNKRVDNLKVSDFTIVCPLGNKLTINGSTLTQSEDGKTWTMVIPNRYQHADNNYSVTVCMPNGSSVNRSFRVHLNYPNILGETLTRLDENTLRFEFNSDEKGKVYYGLYEWNGEYNSESNNPKAEDVLNNRVNGINKTDLNSGINTVDIDLNGYKVTKKTKLWVLYVDYDNNYRIGYTDYYKVPQYITTVS